MRSSSTIVGGLIASNCPHLQTPSHQLVIRLKPIKTRPTSWSRARAANPYPSWRQCSLAQPPAALWPSWSRPTRAEDRCRLGDTRDRPAVHHAIEAAGTSLAMTPAGFGRSKAAAQRRCRPMCLSRHSPKTSLSRRRSTGASPRCRHKPGSIRPSTRSRYPTSV